MTETHEQDGTGDPFSLSWCGLDWDSWVAFSTTSRTLENLPAAPGLYRIRPVGQEIMMDIGSTAGSLRDCFAGIRQNVTRAVMPPADPWQVAPALWAWKDAKGYAYEFSSCPYGNGPEERKAAESFLTYRYRLALHESPLCSFGRFHRKYREPAAGTAGAPGGKIGPGEPLNAAGGPSASPLPVSGEPGQPGWMGFSWSPKRSLKTHTTGAVPPGQGYFLVFDAVQGTLLAIGEAEDCGKALFALSRNPWDGRELAYSFACELKPLPRHNLLEKAGDLLGNYIEKTGTLPLFQSSLTG